jgi:hypothetical protein
MTVEKKGGATKQNKTTTKTPKSSGHKVGRKSK